MPTPDRTADILEGCRDVLFLPDGVAGVTVVRASRHVGSGTFTAIAELRLREQGDLLFDIAWNLHGFHVLELTENGVPPDTTVTIGGGAALMLSEDIDIAVVVRDRTMTCALCARGGEARDFAVVLRAFDVARDDLPAEVEGLIDDVSLVATTPWSDDIAADDVVTTQAGPSLPRDVAAFLTNPPARPPFDLLTSSFERDAAADAIAEFFETDVEEIPMVFAQEGTGDCWVILDDLDDPTVGLLGPDGRGEPIAPFSQWVKAVLLLSDAEEAQQRGVAFDVAALRTRLTQEAPDVFGASIDMKVAFANLA